ncbi:hypothetical protein PHMEG_0003913 [Phytophthora megakarya]|uniref:Uncharacterized protein n=1 Tax=Phytophthora megakarya TaxID=4795 RepID=A0A225WWR3_9STRA|nr:hypothetical protein PHMEG_0003913 [Phytophthora megakarya]
MQSNSTTSPLSAQRTEIDSDAPVEFSVETERAGSGREDSGDPDVAPTHVITATVTPQRGTDTTAFNPAVTEVARADDLRNIPASAERYLKPGFVAVGAQKMWCKMLNVSLSVAAPTEHPSPLDFAFLALMHNIKSLRQPWRVLFGRKPSEPLTFALEEFVKGVCISICASGFGGLVRVWRRFFGNCYEDNEKADLCVALWERHHWLQGISLENAVHAIRETGDPLDRFTRVILYLWTSLNRPRNNRAHPLRQHVDRLWEWCKVLAVVPARCLQRCCWSQVTFRIRWNIGVGFRHRGLVLRAAGIRCPEALEELLD